MVSRSNRSLDTTLLVVAATVGTLPVALFTAAATARFLPISADARFALAFGISIPAWVSIMCITLLARSGARALGACVAASLILGCLVLGVGR
jgi:hypothetical protein